MLTRRTFISAAAVALLGTGLPACLSGCGKTDAALSAGSAQAEPISLVTFAFDTMIYIEASCAQEVLDQVEERLYYFESIFSRMISGSDIYAINNADGMPTVVRPETADIITKSIAYSDASNGLFDITIGSVTELWDFKNDIIPDSDELAAALEHVDYRTIGVEGNTVTMTDPVAKLDLGGIAKGYIADDVAQLLRDNGCESALINLGGNCLAIGAQADGTPWGVGLQDPNESRGTVFATIPVSGKSVVASGINERSFEKDGVLYHHLLDPATGMPMQNGTASVSIVSELSVDGDAFSTITFLLGAEAGLAFVAEREDVQALFVDTDGAIQYSDGLGFEVV